MEKNYLHFLLLAIYPFFSSIFSSYISMYVYISISWEKKRKTSNKMIVFILLTFLRKEKSQTKVLLLKRKSVWGTKISFKIGLIFFIYYFLFVCDCFFSKNFLYLFDILESFRRRRIGDNDVVDGTLFEFVIRFVYRLG